MLTRRQRIASEAAAAEEQAAHEKRSLYYITDPNMRNIGPIKVPPGAKSIELSYSEAKFFLGNGLTTVDPEKVAKDRKEQEEKDALAAAEARDKAQAAADAQAAKATSTETVEAADATAASGKTASTRKGS